VALMADKLGRTLGKKRLTLFGLRPRHTATMITVIAGMLIPLITVLLVAAVSNDVRQWILKGQQAIEDSKQLQIAKDNLTKDVEAKTKVNAELQTQNKSLNAKNRDLTSTRAKLVASAKTLNAHVTALSSEVAHFAERFRGMQATLASKQLLLATTDKEFKAANARLLSLQGNYKTLRASYDELNKQTKEAYKQNGIILQQNDAVSKKNNVLNSQIAAAQDQLDKTNSSLEAAKLSLDAAQTDLKQAERDRDRARDQANVFAGFYNANVNSTRTTSEILGAGDEVARVRIPAHSTAEQARGLFASLMRQAETFATGKGAKAHPEETGPFAASLAPRTDSKGNRLPPSIVESTITQGITNQNDDLVLVVTTFANTFMGEWVPLSVQAYGNPLVYHHDEKIAEFTVNGTGTEIAIIEKITDFLTNTVKRKALKDQMIPVFGQEEQFGAVSLSEIIQAAHQVMDAGKPMKVSAIATADTRAGDPLVIHLRVR